jgi:2-methylaconitate cis-trans-isomerase PrpF
MVSAEIEMKDGKVHVPYVTMFRTTRRLFQGEVLYVA